MHKCLVIGLGQIGMGYDFFLDPDEFVLSHAQALSSHDEFELVGGVDNDPIRRKNFISKFNRPAYKDLKEALQVLKPQIVVIATPSNTHGDVLEKVLNQITPKAIVCEKPLDISLKVAKKMVSLCKKRGIPLFVNYIRRSDPGVLKIKTMIQQNIIKSPIKAVVWYSKGLINNGSHMVNLLEYWLGNVMSVEIISDDSVLDQVDPEPDFKMQFKKGSAIFCAAWEEYYSHISIELLSGSGRLFYSEGGNIITWQGLTTDSNKKASQFLSDIIVDVPSELDCYQYIFADNLARALNDEKHNICMGHEALTTLTNVFKIIKKEMV